MTIHSLTDRIPHYGDPLGEQRRLDDGDDSQVGTWAREAIRISNQILGPDDVAELGEKIVFLHLDGSDNVLPLPGDLVYPVVSRQAVGLPQPTDSAIGRITSVANHYELGPIAFAALHQTADAAGLVVITEQSGTIYQIAASG